MSERTENSGQTRRQFIRTGAAGAIGALAGFSVLNSYGRNNDLIRVGLVGCGGRGTGAADDCLNSSPNVKLTAVADLFEDQADKCLKNLTDPDREAGALPGVQVDRDRVFIGFDAYKKLLATDVDLVILATPPGFRPEHFEACVDAGKHVFAEKPMAVDPVGVRRFMAAGQKGRAAGLAMVAGTQRRHDPAYIELIKRVRDGAIGEVLSARAFWCQHYLWKRDRQRGWSDMEWQIRNWNYFRWISGDHIVEQHIHNLDVINWVMDAHPVKALASGGRQQRTAPVYGNVFDHFSVDYEYPNGVHMLSMCRQQEGTDIRIGEWLTGSRGTSMSHWDRAIIRAEQDWRYRGERVNPYVREHADLIASIRGGNPINEAQTVAESTMTAIMGRESAYTGKEVSWDDMMASDLDLTPDKYEFGPHEVRPVPVPGATG